MHPARLARPALRPLSPRRRSALATAMALLLPAALPAQVDYATSGVNSGGESYVSPLEGTSFSPCAGPIGGTSAAVDVACTFNTHGRTIGGGLGSVRMGASATAGGALHAYARSGILYAGADLAAATARSWASYHDGIIFTGYVPAFLRVSAVLHGGATASRYPCETTCGQNGPSDDPPPDAALGELHVTGGDETRIITADASSPEAQTATWDLPVSLYWSDQSQLLYYHFNVSLMATTWAGPGTFAEADFGSTAWISAIRAISAEGCDLADAGCDVTELARQGGVRSASGATYGGFTSAVPTTTAPEPATAALLGVGLTALAAIRRRRAR